MSTAHMVESSKQRWQPAAAVTALSMTASTASTASTAPSKTQRITAFITGSTSSKNWRGKYLRALNISTPEVDVVSRKKHTLISASTSTTSAASTAALGTPAQRRMRGYRVDPNNRNSVTFSRSFSTSTEREGDKFQARVNRYQVSQAARYSNNSRRSDIIIKEPRLTSSTTSSNRMGYSFAMKPDLARGRRCHTDPFVSGEDVNDKTTEKMASAPIQIPSAATNSMDFRGIGGKLSDIDGATTINKNCSSKRYGSKSPVKNQSNKGSKSNNNNQDVTTGGGNLLSWEEPAVMMGAVAMNGSKPVGGGGGAGLGGLDIAFSNVQINSSNNTRSMNVNGVGDGVDDVFCDEFVDTEDEDDRDENDKSHDDDDLDSDDDDDDEIFEMEDFDSDNSMKVNSSSGGDNNNKFHNSSENSNSNSKSRRRRTASEATAIPTSRRSSALPRHHSVRQMRANGTPSSPAMELPKSFVPPHQMIQRDCFSIGLRDEFKRRQAKI